MTGANLARATFAGIIATFVMTAVGFWQAGIGLPAIDVGAMLLANLNAGTPEGASPLYSIAWGQAMHFLNGVVLALIYAKWVEAVLPGGGILKGLLYGVLTTLLAGLIVVPIITNATDAPAGILFSNTDNAVMRVIGALAIHLAYGVTLGALYESRQRTAEVRAM